MIDYPRILQSDPEAAELAACYVAVPGGMLDLVSGTYGTRSGTADTSRSNDLGNLDSLFDGTGDYYTFGSSTLISTSSPWTIVWESILDSFPAANDFPCIGWFKSGVASNPFRIAYTNSAAYADLAWGSITTWNTGKASLSSVGITGVRHWGVLVYNGAGAGTYINYQPYINGIALSVTDAGAFGSVTDGNLVSGSTTDNEWNGGIRQVRVYNRAWGESEACRFYDPSTRDSLFAKPKKRIYFGIPTASSSFIPAWAMGATSIVGVGVS